MRDERGDFAVGQALSERAVPAGNAYDKYGSRNPIVRYLMQGFQRALDELVAIAAPASIHEVGCGEGFWAIRWAAGGIVVRGSDLSPEVVEIARSNAARRGLGVPFRAASIDELSAPDDAAEMVVCCEVLEHVDAPDRALAALTALADPWLIVSVPREPIWRAMNMARGRYLAHLGNTPGHIQHWSARAFLRLLATQVEVVAVRTPLPWTMALCRTRAAGRQPSSPSLVAPKTQTR